MSANKEKKDLKEKMLKLREKRSKGKVEKAQVTGDIVSGEIKEDKDSHNTSEQTS